jgi:hypothetical protein
MRLRSSNGRSWPPRAARRLRFRFVALVLPALLLAAPLSAQILSPADREYRARMGLLALDRYLETWNTRDAERWATALHFPHVRPGAGDFEVWATRDEYIARSDFDRVLATGWVATRWDDQRVLHVGHDKVHVAGWWNRVDAKGTSLLRGQMVYIVTQRDGLWRLEVRFAAGPPLGGDDAAAAEHRRAALAAIDAYHAAVNAHDAEALAEAVHFPHVRHGDDRLEIWRDRAEYLAGAEPGRARTWAETRVLRSEVIQVSSRGANVAVTYGRASEGGRLLSEHDAILLVTLRNGAWKVQAISTMGT